MERSIRVSSTASFISIFFFILTVFLTTETLWAKEATKLYANESPAFTIEYPAYIQKSNKYLRNKEVFRGMSARKLPVLAISVSELPKNYNPEKDAHKNHFSFLKTIGKNVKLVSSKRSKLSDGTPAIEIIYIGDYSGKAKVYTIYLEVIKDNRIVGVHISTDAPLIKDLQDVAYSLKFKAKEEKKDKEPIKNYREINSFVISLELLGKAGLYSLNIDKSGEALCLGIGFLFIHESIEFSYLEIEGRTHSISIPLYINYYFPFIDAGAENSEFFITGGLDPVWELDSSSGPSNNFYFTGNLGFGFEYRKVFTFRITFLVLFPDLFRISDYEFDKKAIPLIGVSAGIAF